MNLDAIEAKCTLIPVPLPKPEWGRVSMVMSRSAHAANDDQPYFRHRALRFHGVVIVDRPGRDRSCWWFPRTYLLEERYASALSVFSRGNQLHHSFGPTKPWRHRDVSIHVKRWCLENHQAFEQLLK